MRLLLDFSTTSPVLLNVRGPLYWWGPGPDVLSREIFDETKENRRHAMLSKKSDSAVRRTNHLFKLKKTLLFFSGNAMNLFLNENWETIVKEVKPVLEDTLADMFKTFSNNIYHKYPLDSLLPP